MRSSIIKREEKEREDALARGLTPDRVGRFGLHTTSPAWPVRSTSPPSRSTSKVLSEIQLRCQLRGRRLRGRGLKGRFTIRPRTSSLRFSELVALRVDRLEPPRHRIRAEEKRTVEQHYAGRLDRADEEIATVLGDRRCGTYAAGQAAFRHSGDRHRS
jgi:hypothetical protein